MRNSWFVESWLLAEDRSKINGQVHLSYWRSCAGRFEPRFASNSERCSQNTNKRVVKDVFT
jgi:hypothetical protein